MIGCPRRVSEHFNQTLNSSGLGELNLKLERILNFPGHALHEKRLQRQKGVVLLVSSQEQRAYFVPRIRKSLTNRLSIGRYVPPSVFPDMPSMKRVYKEKKRLSNGQQPGTKSASRLADKPRINRSSTAGFFPPPV